MPLFGQDQHSSKLYFSTDHLLFWGLTSIYSQTSAMQNVAGNPNRYTMPSTDPKNIQTALHLIRAGLASGLLANEEIIDWADKIIIKDDQPDIFFVDLALSVSKSKNDILHYINDYLNFENPIIPGRPLLGLLYKEYKFGKLDLEQTVNVLFQLKFEAIFTDSEESYIYSIDNDYDCAKNKIYGTLQDVQNELENFLSLYKDYSIDNFEKWQDIDNAVDVKVVKNYQDHLEQSEIYKQNSAKENKRSWWKFW